MARRRTLARPAQTRQVNSGVRRDRAGHLLGGLTTTPAALRPVKARATGGKREGRTVVTNRRNRPRRVT